MINKKGFTLTELIIAVSISTIVLIVVFSYIVNVITGIAYSQNKSKKISLFNEYVLQVKEHTNVFPVFSGVIDSTSTGGYDVALYKNFSATGGVLLGLVDPENMKLIKNNTYDFYKKRILGIRTLTEDNLVEIAVNPNKVYEYEFYDDKVVPDIFIIDFQFETYNTGSIIEFSYGMVLDEYNTHYEGKKWGEFPEVNMYNKIVNF